MRPPHRPLAPVLSLLVPLAALAACTRGGEAARAPSFTSTLHRDHPLAGRVWDARTGAFADLAALERAASSADVLLLGEVHDNLDHHALQARLVKAVAAAGRRPILAFEMLDDSQQPALDAALARGERDPDRIAEAVEWGHRGWGAFARYRPIFAAALEAGLPIRAALLPRPVVTAAMRNGPEALPEPVRARLERQPPLTAEVRAALRKEMVDSHCGEELPERALDSMILAQRARDAGMAARLDEAGERGAILVTGNGHARTDRGVPAYLDRDRPARNVLSVAIVEVFPGLTEPGAYAEGFDAQALPADFVVFTPAAERVDPCEEFLKMRRKAPAPGDTRAQQ